MKKAVSTLFILLSVWVASAQAPEEVVVHIGDTLYFGECSDVNYTYIDYYVKTRFEQDKPLSDTATSWHYYSRFFDTGDFDVKRLPCSMQSSYGIIKHLMMVEMENIGEKMIFIAEIEKGKSAAYILADAFASGEVLWSPALQ